MTTRELTEHERYVMREYGRGRDILAIQDDTRAKADRAAVVDIVKDLVRFDRGRAREAAVTGVLVDHSAAVKATRPAAAPAFIAPQPQSLTDIDRATLAMLCWGMNVPQMARAEGVTEHSIRSRIERLCYRLVVPGREEAIEVGRKRPELIANVPMPILPQAAEPEPEVLEEQPMPEIEPAPAQEPVNLDPENLPVLTDTERLTLKLLREGLNVPAIAGRLDISGAAANSRCAQLRRRLGVANSAAAAALAERYPQLLDGPTMQEPPAVGVVPVDEPETALELAAVESLAGDIEPEPTISPELEEFVARETYPIPPGTPPVQFTDIAEIAPPAKPVDEAEPIRTGYAVHHRGYECLECGSVAVLEPIPGLPLPTLAPVTIAISITRDGA